MSDKEQIKILVPIDFRQESINGLLTAIEIAQMKNGKITIFHIRTHLEHLINQGYKGFVAQSSAYKLGDKQLQEEKEKTKMELKTLALNYGIDKIPFSIEVATGYFKEELEKHLKNNHVDLIVMGRSGTNSLGELFTGNKIEQSIRLSRVPVLAVKKFHNANELKKMLLAVELRDYDDEVIETIRQVPEYLEMHIYIAYVKHSSQEQENEILHQLEDFTKKYKFRNYSAHILSFGKSYKNLEDFADRNGIDIIASITQGNTGLFKLIYGSNTDELIGKTGKSVLAVEE